MIAPLFDDVAVCYMLGRLLQDVMIAILGLLATLPIIQHDACTVDETVQSLYCPPAANSLLMPLPATVMYPEWLNILETTSLLYRFVITAL